MQPEPTHTTAGDPYAAGDAAFWAFAPLSANPFQRGTEPADLWADGWTAAQVEADSSLALARKDNNPEVTR